MLTHTFYINEYWGASLCLQLGIEAADRTAQAIDVASKRISGVLLAFAGVWLVKIVVKELRGGKRGSTENREMADDDDNGDEIIGD